MKPAPELTSRIKQNADRCVLCGTCLPHCPTYQLRRDENESPRGRIALMSALASGQITPSPTLLSHLQSCLNCRACERACPSGVPYGELLADTHALTGVSEPLSVKILRRLLTGRGLAWLRPVRFYQNSGFQRLVRRSAWLRTTTLGRLDSLLPAPQPTDTPPARLPSLGVERGHVALFLGCTSRPFEGELLRSAIRLLRLAGYTVHIPTAQACCGSLDLQAGKRRRALSFARRNVAAFAGYEAIVTIASGCGAALHDYPSLLPGAEEFSSRIEDIHRFLARVEWPPSVSFAPLTMPVALHIPCTLRNTLRQEEGMAQVLRRIPDIQLLFLADNERCCGAAGQYALTHPAVADQLREAKLEALAASGAQLLATANIGCALHLAAGARERGMQVETVHPITLLNRQVRSPALAGGLLDYY